MHEEFKSSTEIFYWVKTRQYLDQNKGHLMPPNLKKGNKNRVFLQGEGEFLAQARAECTTVLTVFFNSAAWLIFLLPPGSILSSSLTKKLNFLCCILLINENIEQNFWFDLPTGQLLTYLSHKQSILVLISDLYQGQKKKVKRFATSGKVNRGVFFYSLM